MFLHKGKGSKISWYQGETWPTKKWTEHLIWLEYWLSDYWANISNSDADDEPSSLHLFPSHYLQLHLSQLPPQPEEEEEMILGAFKNF